MRSWTFFKGEADFAQSPRGGRHGQSDACFLYPSQGQRGCIPVLLGANELFKLLPLIIWDSRVSPRGLSCFEFLPSPFLSCDPIDSGYGDGEAFCDGVSRRSSFESISDALLEIKGERLHAKEGIIRSTYLTRTIQRRSSITRKL